MTLEASACSFGTNSFCYFAAQIKAENAATAMSVKEKVVDDVHIQVDELKGALREKEARCQELENRISEQVEDLDEKDEVVEGGDDDDNLFNLMKDKLKSKVKESMSTKEKMEVLVPEKEEKPKEKKQDLYGEQKSGDPIEEPKPFVPKSQVGSKNIGAVTPNRK